MKFRISSLLILLFLLSVALSLFVYETTTSVAADISYKVPVKLVYHSEISGKAFYAIVASENLSDALKVWQTPDDKGVFQVDKASPDGAPPMTELTSETTVILVPRFEMRSPLLKRKIPTEQPCDCIVIYTSHEFGCSYSFKSEGNWKDGQEIEIDLRAAIDWAKQRNESE